MANLGEPGEDGTILTAVVQMANALGMTVIAEGVETRQQLNRVIALGYELAQGYYFGRPRPVAELEAPFRAVVARDLAETA